MRNTRRKRLATDLSNSLSSPHSQDFCLHTEVHGLQYAIMLPELNHLQVGTQVSGLFKGYATNHCFKGISIPYVLFPKNDPENAGSPFFPFLSQSPSPFNRKKKTYILLWHIALGYEAQPCPKHNWKYPGHSENVNYSNE